MKKTVTHDGSFLLHQCAQEQAHQGRWEDMVVSLSWRQGNALQGWRWSVLIGQRVRVAHIIGRVGAILCGIGEETIALQPT